MSNSRFNKARLTAAFIWSVIIFALLTMRPPAEMSGVIIPGLDKIAHIGVFGMMSFLFLRSIIFKPTKKDYFTVIVICSLYGFLLECIQALPFTGRDFDIFDIIANIIGANIAATFFYILNQEKHD
jgi:VanZ family protein